MKNNSVRLLSFEVMNDDNKLKLLFSFPIDKSSINENIRVYNPIKDNYIPYDFTIEDNGKSIILNFVSSDIVTNEEYTLYIKKDLKDVFKRKITEVREFNFSFYNRLLSKYSIVKPTRNESFTEDITVTWKEDYSPDDLVALNDKLLNDLRDSKLYENDDDLNTAFDKKKYYLITSARIQISEDPFFVDKLYDEITTDTTINISLDKKHLQLFIRVRPELEEVKQSWSETVSFIYGVIKSKIPTYIDETKEEDNNTSNNDTSTTPETTDKINLVKYTSDDITNKIIFRFDDNIKEEERVEIRVTDLELFENDIPFTHEFSNNNKDLIINLSDEVAQTLKNKQIKIYLTYLENFTQDKFYKNDEPFMINFIKYPYFVDIEDVLTLIRETNPNLQDVSYNIKNASELALACITDIDENNPSYFTKQFVRYRAAYDSIINFFVAKSSSAGTKGKVGDVEYSTSNSMNLKPLLDTLKEEEAKFKDAAISKSFDGSAAPASAVRGAKSRPQFTDINLGYNRGHNGRNMIPHTTVPFPNSINNRW